MDTVKTMVDELRNRVTFFAEEAELMEKAADTIETIKIETIKSVLEIVEKYTETLIYPDGVPDYYITHYYIGDVDGLVDAIESLKKR